MKLADLAKDGARLFRRLLGDPHVPRPIKWLLALAVLPIPGPVDELAGGLALAWLLRRSPGLVSEHWVALRSERREPAPISSGRTGDANV